ncbi:hypothetical protein D3C76_615780 [compost metagenome]
MIIHLDNRGAIAPMREYGVMRCSCPPEITHNLALYVILVIESYNDMHLMIMRNFISITNFIP